MIFQKNIFLKQEADNWFDRNKSILKKKSYKKDFIIKEVEILINENKIKNILEIGCGDGNRLSYLKKINKVNCFGIDPSSKALKSNNDKNIKLKKGTADRLPYIKDKFDLVIFSFCLFLCDDTDLSKIVNETFRVTKKNSFILIYDFYYGVGVKYQNYKHNTHLKCRKMNYGNLFSWHPRIQLIKIKKKYEKSNQYYKQKKLNCTALHVMEKSF